MEDGGEKECRTPTDTSGQARNNEGLNQYGSVGGVNYSYDLNGNLTNDGTYKYYYDCENHLSDVNDQSNNRVASYKYDYLGRRVSKTIHDTLTTIHYTYDGDQVIAEYDGNDTLLRKFIYGPGIDEPVCMIDIAGGNVIYYYHFNGLGSVAALSNNSGQIVERYSYDVFGAPNRVSDVNNPYMFTGRRFDPETALYYYRARYYAPDIGRFLQTDPIGYYGGLNLYTYVGNNPINWVDPYGLCWDCIRRVPSDAYHAAAAWYWGAEGVVFGGVGYALEHGLGHISNLGVQTIYIPTPRGPIGPWTVDFRSIGAVADAVDVTIGDRIREHAEASFYTMRYHADLSHGLVPHEMTSGDAGGESPTATPIPPIPPDPESGDADDDGKKGSQT